MLVTAKEDHVCSCCGRTIRKGEKCYVYFVNTPESSELEYEVFYECRRCTEERVCRPALRGKKNV